MGAVFSRSNRSHETSAAGTRSGPSAALNVAVLALKAATCSKLVACRRQSKKLAGATENRPYCGTISLIRTSASASGYGSGRSSTPLTTLKIALVAPMPSARVRMAAIEKPGDFTSCRVA